MDQQYGGGSWITVQNQNHMAIDQQSLHPQYHQLQQQQQQQHVSPMQQQQHMSPMQQQQQQHMSPMQQQQQYTSPMQQQQQYTSPMQQQQQYTSPMQQQQQYTSPMQQQQQYTSPMQQQQQHTSPMHQQHTPPPQQQSLASHFNLLPLIESLAEVTENGSRDQHSDSLVNELTNHFEKCQQLLNSISGSIDTKSMTVEGQKAKLEESQQQLNERRDLIAKYRRSIEELINSASSR